MAYTTICRSIMAWGTWLITQTYISTYVYISLYLYVHMYSYLRHMCVNVYAHASMYSYAYMYMYGYVCIYVCMSTHIYIYVHHEIHVADFQDRDIRSISIHSCEPYDVPQYPSNEVSAEAPSHASVLVGWSRPPAGSPIEG